MKSLGGIGNGPDRAKPKDGRKVNRESKHKKPPRCHMTSMKFVFADDGCQQVEFYECVHCGHTIEIQRYLAG